MNTAIHAGDPVALTCWKDIAQFLGKGVRTVQRWERDLGLPVRRPRGSNGNSAKSPVAADPRDLEAWLRSRWALRAETENIPVAVRVQTAPLHELEFSLQKSRELQATLKAARQQHQDLVRQIQVAVMTLGTTCQRLICPPTAIRDHISRESREQPAGR